MNFRIDGDNVAADIMVSLAGQPLPPGAFTIVACGTSPASLSFINRKRIAAEALGIPFVVRDIPADATEGHLAQVIADLSADPHVRAVVLQLPLPVAFDRDVVIACIDPLKDIDNLTGRASVESPSVLVVQEILSRAGCDITDFKHVVVVGRGFLVGLPVVRWLAAAGIMHMAIDIDTPDPQSIIRRADLVISGAGKTGVVDPAILADDAGFIDFGFPPDADQQSLASHAGRLRFFTPTPHGTGPILVAKLFENFYSLR